MEYLSISVSRKFIAPKESHSAGEETRLPISFLCAAKLHEVLETNIWWTRDVWWWISESKSVWHSHYIILAGLSTIILHLAKYIIAGSSVIYLSHSSLHYQLFNWLRGPYLREDLYSIIFNWRTNFFKCRWYCVLYWGCFVMSSPAMT